ncbi:MAG: TetR family transcriptional regulator [Phormidesmis sp.]
MAEGRLSSRKRIVRSALALFSVRGITATTTKEIAERAGVNEVTLFRQFGNKQGLLLAVMQEAPILALMQAALTDIVGANDPLVAYGSAALDLLGRVPELVRSLIGEAGVSPLENQRALAKALRQANRQTVIYLRGEQVSCAGLSVEEIAKLLNTLMLGYALIESSGDGQTLWSDQADFLSAINCLFSVGDRVITDADTSKSIDADDATESDGTIDRDREVAMEASEALLSVRDLPAAMVRSLFLKAKKQDAQAYALMYVLFGAGLRLEECAALRRSQVFASKTQHILSIPGSLPRQVPVNRWIMGRRYGTYLKNPLTQWLKSRQDDCPNVFAAETGEALDQQDLSDLWQAIAGDADSFIDIAPFQARQTWCIELLSKGMSLDNLSLLSGLSLEALAPYAQRTKEKAALEQALAIDQKNG